MPIVRATGVWDTHATITTLANNTATLNSIWTGWINDDARSTYITQTATSTVWTYWVNSTTSCTTTASDYHNVRVRDPSPRRPPEPVLTEAQRRMAALNQAAATRRRAEEQAALVARAEAAEKRAEQLLVENLSLKQREEYLRHKAFTVHGRIARYRIRRGRSGNVDVVNEQGILTHRLCAHPGAQVPDCDTMLAQKLMLEHDEHAFVRRANVHPALSGHQRVMEPLH